MRFVYRKSQKLDFLVFFIHITAELSIGSHIALRSGNTQAVRHIGAAGGVKQAIQAAKEYAPFVRKIEVETENLDMVREAVEAGADIIMLDNMDHDQMQEAIRLINGRAEIEISGNVTPERIETIKDLAVDYISSGALTHSAPILDVSLKNLRPIDR